VLEVVAALLADRILGDEALAALVLALRMAEVGASCAQRGLGLTQLELEAGGVELDQRIAKNFC
jgi:hypothetical protein